MKVKIERYLSISLVTRDVSLIKDMLYLARDRAATDKKRQRIMNVIDMIDEQMQEQ